METLFQFAGGKRQVAGRAAQREHFPAQGSGAGFQFNGGGLQTTGAVEGDGFLGQVFQDRVFGYLQPGVLAPGHAMAVGLVQFRRGRGGQKRVPTFGHRGFDAQFVAAHQATRGMQQVHMAAAGFALRVEGALHPQWTMVAPAHQPGYRRRFALGTCLKAQFQGRRPAPFRVETVAGGVAVDGLVGGHTVRCCLMSSSVSPAISPSATRRPRSRMAKRSAYLRANGSFCSTSSTVRPSSSINRRITSPI